MNRLSRALPRLGEGLLLFFCCFLPFRLPLIHLLGDWVKYIPDVLILSFFALFAAEKRLRFRLSRTDLLFLLFLAFAFCGTCLIARLRCYLFLHQTRSIGLYYIFAFCLRRISLPKHTPRRMLRTLQAVSWPLAALGIVERLCSKTVLFQQDFAEGIYSFDNFGRVYSLFYNPNTYGLFLVLLLLFSLNERLRSGTKTPLALYAQIAVMLFLTMSRSSILILAAVLALSGILLGKPLWRQWKSLLWRGAVIACCVAAVSLLLPRAAEQYYFAQVQPRLEWDGVRPLSREVQTVSFTAPDGSDYDGWLFNGITYVDARCAIPLREQGSVLHLPADDAILTSAGAIPLSDFAALEETERQALLEAAPDPDSPRERHILSNRIYQSLRVDSGTRLSALTQARTYQVNVNGRFFSVLTALRIARANPIFGTGFGTYGSAASSSWLPPQYEVYGLAQGFYADCQYACVLAETGFPGLLLFLGFLLSAVWDNRKSLPAVILCLILGWYGLFFNMLEVQIASLLLWSLPALEKQECPLTLLREGLREN